MCLIDNWLCCLIWFLVVSIGVADLMLFRLVVFA